MLINNLAPILAPVAGSTMLLFTNWRGVFVLLGVIGIFLILLVTFNLEYTLPPEDRVPSNLGQTFKNFLSLLKDRQLVVYALTQVFSMSVIFAYVSGTLLVYQNIYCNSALLFYL